VLRFLIREFWHPSWLVTDFVERVEVLDKYQVKFVLKNPVAYFPSLVATVPYYPVNPNIYPADKHITNPSELKGGKLVGLGPYRVIFFKRDQQIALEANPWECGPMRTTSRGLSATAISSCPASCWARPVLMKTTS
jgi:peptide/nickel transport system substrate-binding protein